MELQDTDVLLRSRPAGSIDHPGNQAFSSMYANHLRPLVGGTSNSITPDPMKEMLYMTVMRDAISHGVRFLTTTVKSKPDDDANSTANDDIPTSNINKKNNIEGEDILVEATQQQIVEWMRQQDWSSSSSSSFSGDPSSPPAKSKRKTLESSSDEQNSTKAKSAASSKKAKLKTTATVTASTAADSPSQSAAFPQPGAVAGFLSSQRARAGGTNNSFVGGGAAAGAAFGLNPLLLQNSLMMGEMGAPARDFSSTSTPSQAALFSSLNARQALLSGQIQQQQHPSLTPLQLNAAMLMANQNPYLGLAGLGGVGLPFGNIGGGLLSDDFALQLLLRGNLLPGATSMTTLSGGGVASAASAPAPLDASLSSSAPMNHSTSGSRIGDAGIDSKFSSSNSLGGLEGLAAAAAMNYAAASGVSGMSGPAASKLKSTIDKDRNQEGKKKNDTAATSSSSVMDEESIRRIRDHQSEQWAQRFDDLKVFREKHGHCLVPHAYPDNPALGKHAHNHI